MELFDTLHKQGVTIIMITHSDEIASYADRVVKIIDGELYEGDAQPVNAASAQKEQDNLTEVVQPEQAQTSVTGGDEHE